MNGGRQLIDLYQKTVEDVKVTDSHSAGAFTLGLSPLFGACFFGDLIPNFSAAYPNIRITMIEDGANKINQRVEEGTVDLAVTLKTDRTQTYGNCHFSTQRNVAQLHKDHPLAQEEMCIRDRAEEKEFPIVRTKRFSVKPMSPEEAILQMNLLDHSFFVFRSSEDDGLSIVYRRKNGGYGLIVTDEEE